MSKHNVFLKRSCPVKIPYKSSLTHEEHSFYLIAFLKYRARPPKTSVEHRERVKQHLMELSADKIHELIGSIDPSDVELNSLFTLLLEVKKEKKNSCNLS